MLATAPVRVTLCKRFPLWLSLSGSLFKLFFLGGLRFPCSEGQCTLVEYLWAICKRLTHISFERFAHLLLLFCANGVNGAGCYI